MSSQQASEPADQTTVVIAPKVTYAPFGKRLYAYLIDQSIIQLLAMAVAYPIGLNKWGGSIQDMEYLLTFVAFITPVLVWLQVIIGIIYGAAMEGSRQRATWGKKLCGLRVVPLAGEGRIDLLSAIGRNLAINALTAVFAFSDFFLFLLILLAYFTPLISSTGQAFYDRFLGAVVIVAGKEKAVG